MSTQPHESTLPQSVLNLIEMTPTEDLILALLRDAIPDVQVNSLIAADQRLPFILVRRAGDWGEWEGDPRFLDAGQIDIHTYAAGLHSNEDAALLAEAVRVVLRDSLNKVVPKYGYLTYVRMVESPTRAPDWTTSVGPVQYADLPAGTTRYHTKYEVEARRPSVNPYRVT